VLVCNRSRNLISIENTQATHNRRNTHKPELSNDTCISTTEPYCRAITVGQRSLSLLEVDNFSVNNKIKSYLVCFTDVDECASSDHNCPSNSLCVNLQPGFTCQCLEGYVSVHSFCAGEKKNILSDYFSVMFYFIVLVKVIFLV